MGLLPFVVTETTEGVRIDVESFYLAEQSDPVADRYVFAYHIRITNESEASVQLMRRHWIIEERADAVREVEGDGVVGKQPVMEPGESHEYTSGAVLEVPTGRMHGTYEMHRADGTVFRASIPQFKLEMPRTLH